MRQAGTWAGGQEEDWALSQTGAVRGATAVRVPLRAQCVGGASTPARSESLLFGFLFVVILGDQETRAETAKAHEEEKPGRMMLGRGRHQLLGDLRCSS